MISVPCRLKRSQAERSKPPNSITSPESVSEADLHTVDAATSTKPFPFLLLPGELRNKIYLLAFRRAKESLSEASDGSYWYSWPCSVLLLLNKQVHREDLPFVYGHPRRTFTITRPGRPIRWLQTIGPTARGYIADLRLILEYDEDLIKVLCLLASCVSLKLLWIKLRVVREHKGPRAISREAHHRFAMLTGAPELLRLQKLEWLSFMHGSEEITVSFGKKELAWWRMEIASRG